jgi:hypothetical protein
MKKRRKALPEFPKHITEKPAEEGISKPHAHASLPPIYSHLSLADSTAFFVISGFKHKETDEFSFM